MLKYTKRHILIHLLKTQFVRSVHKGDNRNIVRRQLFYAAPQQLKLKLNSISKGTIF